MRRVCTPACGRGLATVALWTSLSLAAGCTAEPDPFGGGKLPEAEDTVSGIRQAVTGGTRVPHEALDDNAVVRLSVLGGTCSGALISNRWVLTADHCFCPNHVDNPSWTTVTIYGTEDAANDPNLAPVYQTVAAQIIRHPDKDVALVELERTLPFDVPPLIFEGDGSELADQTVRVMGFGHNRIVDGQPEGGGESLNFGYMRVTRTDIDGGKSLRFCNPDSDNYWLKDRPGPRLASLPGEDVDTEKGDSGGPVWWGDGRRRQIVGVMSGSDQYGTAATGIWYVRQWIKDNTDIWSHRECTDNALPNSWGYTDGALAMGPDGGLHVVARGSGGEVAHWRSSNGRDWTFEGTVQGVSAAGAPAITTEMTAVAGQPYKMGLAYRNASDDVLYYARWAEGQGWSGPTAIPSGLRIGGDLAAWDGIIAFVGTDGRPAATAYLPDNDDFFPAQWLPGDAPPADLSRRISIIFEPSMGASILGYRTADNEWVQTWGHWDCQQVTGSYFCHNDPPYATDWQGAGLGYVSGERAHVIATRPGSFLPYAEMRTLHGPAALRWGETRYAMLGRHGVGASREDVYVVSNTFSGLAVRPIFNCFGNDF